MAAARSVSSDEAVARRALKLGPKSVGERLRNLTLDTAASLPAIERYTGVLYDPLDVSAADEQTLQWWSSHVVIQSAMFGPIGAGDRIPAYRLSHDARLEGVRLSALWPAAGARALASRAGGDSLVLDLRSEGYRALGPVPGAVVLRVVSEDPAGRRRAVNHWNKTAKGRLVALLGRTRADVGSMDDLVAWARSSGVIIDARDGEWELVAESVASAEAVSRSGLVLPS
jgi:cytoplasmic iron level regulating protein YaaA (DUF328/UPF0246 family)